LGNKLSCKAFSKKFWDCSPVRNFKGTTTPTLAVNVTIEYEDGTAYEAINEVRLAVVSPETAKNNNRHNNNKKSESNY
jgi:hypothetical protein